MKLKNLSVIDQAYYIMVGLNGSWLYNSTSPSNKDKKWCENFVNGFKSDYGMEVHTEYGTCEANKSIQNYIDDCSDDIKITD